MGKGNTDGNDDEDRHRTGSFYTPRHVTEYNSRRAIEARAMEHLDATISTGHGTIEEVLAKGKVKELKALYFTILKGMKVVDPACGDGAFLVQGLRTLTSLRRRCLAALGERRCRAEAFRAEREAEEKGLLGISVVKDNIYGVDLDKEAVDICRRNLADEAVSGGRKVPARSVKVATCNIRHGNSLMGFVRPPVQTRIIDFGARPSGDDQDSVYLSSMATRLQAGAMAELKAQPIFHWSREFPEVFANDGFDVVLGNPPYGDRALTKAERDALRSSRAFRTTVTDPKGKGSVNPSSVFIERALELLRDGGQMALILPSSITRVQEFEKVRRLLLDGTGMWHMVDEGSPFKGVTLEMFSLFARKGGPPPVEGTMVTSRREGMEGLVWKVPASVFDRYDRFMLYWDQTFDRISDGASTGVLTGTRGPTVPQNRYIDRKDGAHTIPLLVSGKAIGRFRLVPSEFHWASDKVLELQSVRSTYDSTILVGTRLKDHYRVCVKPPGYAVADNVIRLDFDRRTMTPEAMSVILNSRLMRYTVSRYLFNNSALTLFIQSVAQATPIRSPTDMDLFTTVGRAMHGLGDGLPDTKARMEEMDRSVADPLVYELYLYGSRGLGLSKALAGSSSEDILRRVQESETVANILDSIYSNPVVKRIEASDR